MTKLTETRKTPKRKKPDGHCSPSPCPPSKSSKNANVTAGPFNDSEPFPDYSQPTPEECRAVRDDLLALHGFPKEFIKYRKQRSLDHIEYEEDDTSDAESSTESVLDGLINAILSQNTTEANSQKAFASLKSSFPTWECVLAADAKLVEDTIRCGGMGVTWADWGGNPINHHDFAEPYTFLPSLTPFESSSSIKWLCLPVMGKKLRDYLKDDMKRNKAYANGGAFILKDLITNNFYNWRFTSFYDSNSMQWMQVACVLMFQLQRDDFPVDTHIFQIAKTLHWVPAAADVKKTYIHLNQRIPDELKFDLNCLIYTHGKVCRECSGKGSNKPKKEQCDKLCPLLGQSSNAI
ncbi:hypothetical protein KY289_017809 [Solanum tuberosum]|nr:hypothetical protein KY289_017809 [Solanum tuberosum]